MTWLFGQLWVWLLVAFLVGSLLTWLIAALLLPHVDDLESDVDVRTKGLLS